MIHKWQWWCNYVFTPAVQLLLMRCVFKAMFKYSNMTWICSYTFGPTLPELRAAARLGGKNLQVSRTHS